MPIWTRSFTLDDLAAICRGTTDEHIGLRVTAFGEDWLEGTVAIDARTQDETTSLHPGALAILAEALGSIGANLCVDQARHYCLGQILEVHHPQPIDHGPVCGRTTPLLITPHSQTWQTDIRDATGARVCVSQLTMIVLERPSGRPSDRGRSQPETSAALPGR
jgi:1,4-dihydroxy-2-naphthoyl-CoA hydrolase